MQVTVVDHPLAKAALTALRDQDTGVTAFREAMGTLSGILGYEAARDLSTVEAPITTPITDTIGISMGSDPWMVPVLRAGLGLLPGVLAHLPGAPTAFVGVRRNEETLMPEPYLNTVPADLSGAEVWLLDPMLATGGSLNHAASEVRRCGAGSITAVCVLAAPEGVAAVEREGLVDRLVVAAIDDHLDENSYIVPGLGDAGDRLYGPA